ncbi:PQQ-like beta-propeller repeat protein [Catellatospora vulcania]|uniref:PQQ-like beta-propeller repeat protein n=1 Tax=Catellatospora vulcania TaxID=1460450 RepID=UPI0018AF9555|nr:PQQ-like beta-propeller repeat protein [Catellatospora vulcania]
MNGEPTTGTTAVIDLGVGWREHHPPPDRPNIRALVRPLAAVAALVLLLALGGAAPARRLEELATITITGQGDYQIVNETLLVRDADRLSGYSLIDGTQRWNIALPGTADSPMTAGSTVPGLMLTAMTDKITGRVTTYAVDADTGVIRWQGDRAMYPLADVAVGIWSPDDTDRFSTQVSVRDVRTGQPRWSAQQVLAAIDYQALARDQDQVRIWTLQSTGELIERDLRDGRVLRSHRLDLGTAVPVDLSIIGDEFVLETALGGVKTTARYATADLAPIPLTAPYVRRVDCGGYWCVSSQPADSGPAENPVELVDKATGVVRRRLPGGSVVIPTSLGLLVADADPLPAGYPAKALLDAATARPLLDLRGWDLYTDSAASATVLVRGAGHNPVQVAWFTPGGLDLSQLPVRAEGCAFSARATVCPREPGTLGVWRLTS